MKLMQDSWRLNVCKVALLLCLLLPVAVSAADPEPPEVMLMRQGVDHYESNDLDQARQAFENAEIECRKECAVIPYYLGLIDLQREEQGSTIFQWRQFAAVAPEYKYTPTIRKYVTLLKRREAEKIARNQAEKPIRQRPADNAVAVIPFQNLNPAAPSSIGKGLTTLVTEDLSHFKSLKMIAPEDLQAELKAMGRADSGLMDKRSAVEIGRQLSARLVVYGTFTVIENERLKLSTFMVETQSGATKIAFNTQGKLKKFYDLTKGTACRIAVELGQDCDDTPEDFEQILTKSLSALTFYSQGLNYLDKADYDAAKVAFESALEEDDDFELAQRVLAETPTSAMLALTESEMIADAATNAPTVAMPIESQHDTTSGKQEIITQDDDENKGVSGWFYIGGGVLAAGGAGAAVALSGGEEKSDSSPAAPVNIQGEWRGTWTTAAADAGGEMVLALTASDTALSGKATLNGSDCLAAADVNGSVDGDQIQLHLTSANGSADLNARADLSAGKMEGTLAITSGDCAGGQLSVSLFKTGKIGVSW